jgi:deoxyribose-phosphate aldolase
LAQAIDHTKLTFSAGEDEQRCIAQLCEEAKAYGFFSVCVRPRHVALCRKLLAGSPVKVATVIGFPQAKVQLAAERIAPSVGRVALSEKIAEALQAIQDGADELDWVIDVALLKQWVQNHTSESRAEWEAIQRATAGVPVKVIIEIDLLSDADIEQATRWCAETGMRMVKTSTGMVEGGQGATPEAVDLIRGVLDKLGSATQIKASGGIKTQAQALDFIRRGVSRLGTSSGPALVAKVETVDPSAY